MKTMLKRLGLTPPRVMAATSSLALEEIGENPAPHGALVLVRQYFSPGSAYTTRLRH